MNLSRDNLSREIGRTASAVDRHGTASAAEVTKKLCRKFMPEEITNRRRRVSTILWRERERERGRETERRRDGEKERRRDLFVLRAVRREARKPGMRSANSHTEIPRATPCGGEVLHVCLKMSRTNA